MLSSGIGESGWDAGRVPEGGERTLAARRRDARAKMSRPRTWLPDERTHRAWMPWMPLLAMGRARFFRKKYPNLDSFRQRHIVSVSVAQILCTASEIWGDGDTPGDTGDREKRPRPGEGFTFRSCHPDRANPPRASTSTPPRASPRPHRPINSDRLARSDEKSGDHHVPAVLLPLPAILRGGLPAGASS